ncbi:MAG: bifunctional hydroxymethylpyrimidine kinase/phosphomethylpyrimidine kinase [Firmicutes bacterium]|nr:bifunctional hydroxymethylpyrimidine kinase/phosphomethylpyrimidine kinase [Bacillota bacterium]
MTDPRALRPPASVPRAMTIAGSDSGGGAGIQADLKTFNALRVFGTSALTALTAQNTEGVHGVHLLPAEFVTAQIDVVLDDIGTDAVKTGMLATADIVAAVAERLAYWRRRLGPFPVVVDPVMIAKGGAPLLDASAQAALREALLPLATVVTPNRHEAEQLTGLRIQSLDDARRAAAAIKAMGPAWVVVKGGHVDEEGSEAVDLLYDGQQWQELRAERIRTASTHGTGCTFSAAIAAYLARGEGVPRAVALAKRYITGAIRHAFPLGRGHGPTNPFYPWDEPGAPAGADGSRSANRSAEEALRQTMGRE